jgi:hypothetical protein
LLWENETHEPELNSRECWRTNLGRSLQALNILFQRSQISAEKAHEGCSCKNLATSGLAGYGCDVKKKEDPQNGHETQFVL